MLDQSTFTWYQLLNYYQDHSLIVSLALSSSILFALLLRTTAVHTVHVNEDEIAAHFLSGQVNCSKLRVANLNINIAPPMKFLSLYGQL